MAATATRRRCLLLAGALGLGACGFRLAGGGRLPPALSSLALDTRGFDAGQRAALVRRLQRAGAQLVEQPGADASLLFVRLEAPPDTRLAGSGGSRAVIRLERRLAWRLQRPGAAPAADKVLVQRRELTTDEDNLLAADAERAATVAELEEALYNLLVSQLLRL